jgi:hypothetical protein
MFGLRGRTAGALAGSMLAALALSACGDQPVRTAAHTDAACGRSCATASPHPLPTIDLALQGWRAVVNDGASFILSDLGGVDMCTTPSQGIDCRKAVATLVTDVRKLRDTMSGAPIPAGATTDARVITDALTTTLQGCAEDDAALAAGTATFSPPGDTTSRGLQQLLDVVDGWPSL